MEMIAYAVFGLIIGSFLNVLILREGSKRSILGRSSCPSCGRVLQWFELVPVLSFFVLQGRCRSCRSSISLQYTTVEVATAVLFALVGSVGLNAYEATLTLGIISLFVAIFVYDLYHTLIPDVWSYLAALLSLLYALSSSDASLIWILLSGPLVASPLFLMWLVSRGRWMGLGDAKLALSIGWLLGTAEGMLALLGAFILGSIVSIFVLLPLHAIKQRAEGIGITMLSTGDRRFTMQSEVPFGPFLIVSCLFLWFLHVYGYDLGAFLFGF